MFPAKLGGISLILLHWVRNKTSSFLYYFNPKPNHFFPSPGCLNEMPWHNLTKNKKHNHAPHNHKLKCKRRGRRCATALLTSLVSAEVTRVDIVCPGAHIYGECCCAKNRLSWARRLFILNSMTNLCMVSASLWAPGVRQWLERQSLFRCARDQNKTGRLTKIVRILVVVSEFLTSQ